MNKFQGKEQAVLGACQRERKGFPVVRAEGWQKSHGALPGEERDSAM